MFSQVAHTKAIQIHGLPTYHLKMSWNFTVHSAPCLLPTLCPCHFPLPTFPNLSPMAHTRIKPLHRFPLYLFKLYVAIKFLPVDLESHLSIVCLYFSVNFYVYGRISWFSWDTFFTLLYGIMYMDISRYLYTLVDKRDKMY